MVRQTVEKAKVPNFLIVAIDTQLRDYLTEKGVNVYYKDIQVRSLRSFGSEYRCSRMLPCAMILGSRSAMLKVGLGFAQITKSQKDTGENHAISALKFEIIKEFLLLGWNVLLSDIDIVVVQVRSPISVSRGAPASCRGFSCLCLR